MFLIYLPGGTFIPEGTFISYSRVPYFLSLIVTNEVYGCRLHKEKGDFANKTVQITNSILQRFFPDRYGGVAFKTVDLFLTGITQGNSLQCTE